MKLHFKSWLHRILRLVLWNVLRLVLRIRVVGDRNVPLDKPALLVANHVSLIDGFLIGACLPRLVRFIVWKPYYDLGLLNPLFRLMKVVPLDADGPRALEASIRAARSELLLGRLVCIFAEGSVTRTGNLLPFKRGLEAIAGGLEANIVPVHLDGLWGRPLSFEGGRFFGKWSKRQDYPVTVSFGQPMPPNSTASQVRSEVQKLASEAACARKGPNDLLSLRFIRTAQKYWSHFAIADAGERPLTYGQTLLRCLAIARWARDLPCSPNIGVLLPPSVAAALANVGITMAGKIPVNLDSGALYPALELSRIGTVVTSRVFLARTGIEPPRASVFIEDPEMAALMGPQQSASLLYRLLPPGARLQRGSPDSVATIFFSRTDTLKGFSLSHYNLLSNIEALAQVFPLNAADRVIALLPFHGSPGLIFNLWFPLLSGCGVIYASDSSAAAAVGILVARNRGTVLLATRAMYGRFVQECRKEDLSSLRVAFSLVDSLLHGHANGFREKFSIPLFEGYGCPEIAPLIALNTPGFSNERERQPGNKQGSVGLPLPGISVIAADPETLAPLGPNREGVLMVRGPNLMNTGATPERDGWFSTGDLGLVDQDGFIQIADCCPVTIPTSVSPSGVS